eukprot:gene9885-biopygen5525
MLTGRIDAAWRSRPRLRQRTREVPQFQGSVYKSGEEGLKGIQEWVKMACLLPLFSEQLSGDAVDASLARMLKRSPDAIPPKRAWRYNVPEN